MAIRTFSQSRRAPSSNGSVDITVTWTGLLNGDRGSWFSEPGAVLRSFGLSGTLGAGGTVQLRGSMTKPDDAGWVDGVQTDETLITGASMAALGTVMAGQYTACPAYSPVVTAGDGTTNLTCKAYFIRD